MKSLSQKRPTDLYINCIVLSPFRSEFTFLRNVFRLTGIRMHYAQSLEETQYLLTASGSTVVLVNVIFADGTWRSALSLLGENYPLVTALVVADADDRPFLKDLFQRGACGVIWKPFQFDVVRRLIRAVHEASRERQALREEILSRNDNSGERKPGGRVSEIRSRGY